jgi:two-component system, NtrC family, nitrogen regulation sensor histidine kinase NtrY
MIYKKFGIHVFIRALLVFIFIFFASFAFIKGYYWIEWFLVPIILFLFYNYYLFNVKAKIELEQLVESIHYRDFTRHFDVSVAPVELKPFRNSFNEINKYFKSISKEKETQFLYLKNILEIVDTGILSYELESGEVLWMNESLKQLLEIPYLKTIQSLEKRNDALFQEISLLLPGQKVVTTYTKSTHSLKVLLSATMFENDGKRYKLIAFQNINEALDEGESKAWQKLLSVMTHEIMNSVAPISSLAETLKQRLKDSSVNFENYKDTLADLEMGVDTIKKRSDGLLKFTETYRSLSKINKVNLTKVGVIELFEHIQILLQPNLDSKNIELELILKTPSLFIQIDAGLIEQVLINLMLNAMDAVKETPLPKIIFEAETIGSQVKISIHDNGTGIESGLLDKIFIPFFSTKKSGSGIGLSLCKQIMFLHKGSISVYSTANEGSLFTLTFNTF